MDSSSTSSSFFDELYADLERDLVNVSDHVDQPAFVDANPEDEESSTTAVRPPRHKPLLGGMHEFWAERRQNIDAIRDSDSSPSQRPILASISVCRNTSQVADQQKSAMITAQRKKSKHKKKKKVVHFTPVKKEKREGTPGEENGALTMCRSKLQYALKQLDNAHAEVLAHRAQWQVRCERELEERVTGAHSQLVQQSSECEKLVSRMDRLLGDVAPRTESKVAIDIVIQRGDELYAEIVESDKPLFERWDVFHEKELADLRDRHHTGAKHLENAQSTEVTLTGKLKLQEDTIAQLQQELAKCREDRTKLVGNARSLREQLGATVDNMKRWKAMATAKEQEAAEKYRVEHERVRSLQMDLAEERTAKRDIEKALEIMDQRRAQHEKLCHFAEEKYDAHRGELEQQLHEHSEQLQQVVDVLSTAGGHADFSSLTGGTRDFTARTTAEQKKTKQTAAASSHHTMNIANVIEVLANPLARLELQADHCVKGWQIQFATQREQYRTTLLKMRAHYENQQDVMSREQTTAFEQRITHTEAASEALRAEFERVTLENKTKHVQEKDTWQKAERTYRSHQFELERQMKALEADVMCKEEEIRLLNDRLAVRQSDGHSAHQRALAHIRELTAQLETSKREVISLQHSQEKLAVHMHDEHKAQLLALQHAKQHEDEQGTVRYAADLARMRATHIDELDHLQNAHKAELARLEAHVESVTKKNAQLAAQLYECAAKLESKTCFECQLKAKLHAKELETLERSYARELYRIEEMYKENMFDMHIRHTTDVQGLASDMQAALHKPPGDGSGRHAQQPAVPQRVLNKLTATQKSYVDAGVIDASQRHTEDEEEKDMKIDEQEGEQEDEPEQEEDIAKEATLMINVIPPEDHQHARQPVAPPPASPKTEQEPEQQEHPVQVEDEREKKNKKKAKKKQKKQHEYATFTRLLEDYIHKMKS